MNMIYFDTDIAKITGTREAIILENIAYWVKRNEIEERNFYDGEYWTYNSVKDYQRIYNCWSNRQVELTLNSLEKQGYIKTGNYNSYKFDKTKWYSLTEKGKEICYTEERTEFFNSKLKQKEENEDVKADNGNEESINEDVKCEDIRVEEEDKNVKLEIKDVKYDNENMNTINEGVEHKSENVKPIPLDTTLYTPLYTSLKNTLEPHLNNNNKINKKNNNNSEEEFKEIVQAFNNIPCDNRCKVQRLNPSRIKKIKKAIKIFGKEEVIRLLTEEVIKSNWLTGRVTAKNGSRYKLTLDSILKEEMLVKLKEGDFDNSNDTSNKYSNSYNDYNFYDDNSEPYDNNDEDGFRIGW